MSTRLADEIKQTRPFATLAQEAMLSVERTAAVLGHAFADALRAHGITRTQYNVLRILRGAGANGLCRQEVRERLVAEVPDVTRLIDRLEAAALVTREADANDRRYRNTHITDAGLALLARLDRPVAEIHRQQLGHLTEAELQTLIDLLATVRDGL
jgi:DNA-binding MarR family transcriptional regulator